MVFKDCVTVAKQIIYRLFMLKLARHYILPKHLVGREIVIINYVEKLGVVGYKIRKSILVLCFLWFTLDYYVYNALKLKVDFRNIHSIHSFPSKK